MLRSFFDQPLKILRHEAIWLGLGLLIYLIQAFFFAYHIEPTLDEGVYAYKGYLFLSGRYEPFQDYGPWTNKMPLSFIIPGAVQVLFGHGLRSLRYYALFLNVSILLGLWLTARRLGGKKAAVGLVWVLALSPFTIELYSQAISQVLIAFMLTWMLFFTLSSDRRQWQLIIGAVLAGLMAVTRENMAPVAAFLILYLIWEHGIKKTILPVLICCLTFGIVNAVYWPEILTGWAPWIPASITPFLDPWRYYLGSARGATMIFPKFIERLYAFWHAVYLHFSLWAGVAVGVLLWPWKGKKGKFSKSFLFLLVLFLFLVVIHVYGSIGGRFCIFCFEYYLGFFSPVGYLLMVVSFSQRRSGSSTLQRISSFLAIPLLCGGWGYASSPFTGPLILGIQVPRIRNLQILPGTANLWQLLANKWGWSYDLQKMGLPTLTGFAAGLLIILSAVIISRVFKNKVNRVNFGYISLTIFLFVSVLLTPLARLDTITHHAPCEEDVIASYQETGDFLAEMIPEDALVYWEGAPIAQLLYLPKVRIFPPQLNQRFSFVYGGTPESLYRHGYWNEALAQQWISIADYIVVDEASYTTQFSESLAAQSLEELPSSPPYSGCGARSRLRIFKRK